MANNNKVIIIGFDGGSLEFVKANLNSLPGFRTAIEQGCAAPLNSTYPALTSPAWPCMFTGLNPAQLGMYDFIDLDIRRNLYQPFNANHYRLGPDGEDRTLWGIASKHNKTVNVAGVPMTYPPAHVKGYLIGGIPHAGNKGFTYPPALEASLKKMFNYEVFPNIVLTTPGKEKAYAAMLEENCIKHQAQLYYTLHEADLGNNNFDLLVNVDFTSDAAQHYFWRYQDESNPAYCPDNPYRLSLLKFYKQFDQTVDYAVEYAQTKARETGENYTVMIVSDHGFGPCYGAFQVNDWLAQESYLTYKTAYKNQKTTLNRLTETARAVATRLLSPNTISTLVELLPAQLAERFTFWHSAGEQIRELVNSIDWPNTTAFALGTTGCIFINSKDKYTRGMVPEAYKLPIAIEIAKKLRTLTGPDGKLAEIQAYLKKDIYHGAYIDEAPDIVLVPGHYCPTAIRATPGEKQWSANNIEGSGTHRQAGMFIAYNTAGPVKPPIRPLSIYDITPTALALLGLPVPPGLDGKTIEEIINNK